MRTKHTQGKWTFRNDCIGNGSRYYIESENSFIGDAGGGLQSKEEIKANARLIAAAPDLLKALEAALTAFKEFEKLKTFKLRWPEINSCAVFCDEAIKKATE